MKLVHVNAFGPLHDNFIYMDDTAADAAVSDGWAEDSTEIPTDKVWQPTVYQGDQMTAFTKWYSAEVGVPDPSVPVEAPAQQPAEEPQREVPHNHQSHHAKTETGEEGPQVKPRRKG